MIGGQFNFSRINLSTLDTLYNNKTTGTGFNIIPNVGYFIKDNFAIGVIGKFGISYQRQDYTRQSLIFAQTDKSTNYSLGGFARYYKKINDKFSVFIEGNTLFRYSISNHEASQIPGRMYKIETQTNGFNVGIYAGLVYFPTPKLGIEGSFGSLYYDYSTSKSKNVSYNNHRNASTFGVNLSPSSFYLGMNYYF
jgi:hypothetical protein